MGQCSIPLRTKISSKESISVWQIVAGLLLVPSSSIAEEGNMQMVLLGGEKKERKRGMQFLKVTTTEAEDQESPF